MPGPPLFPAVWLIQSDTVLRTSLGAQLRVDWPNVVEFASSRAALASLAKGRKPAVMVAEPPSGILTKLEFFEQAMAFAPRAVIIFTPLVARSETLPNGAHVFAHPLESAELSGFIRLLAGPPAFTPAHRRTHAPHTAPFKRGESQAQSRL